MVPGRRLISIQPLISGSKKHKRVKRSIVRIKL